MDAKAALRRHENRLLSLPNVNGVGTGQDDQTGRDVIVVYVTRKVPAAELGAQDVVPKEIDGVAVRVVEIGEITSQGAI